MPLLASKKSATNPRDHFEVEVGVPVRIPKHNLKLAVKWSTRQSKDRLARSVEGLLNDFEAAHNPWMLSNQPRNVLHISCEEYTYRGSRWSQNGQTRNMSHHHMHIVPGCGHLAI